jgi:trans-2-enoyl-CoA reductase
MRKINKSQIIEIITDINNELLRMEQLEKEIKETYEKIPQYPELITMLYESLALKLHNFYTGCERIFQIIAEELNGGKPSSFDWHRRLLERMANEQVDRPCIITKNTAKQLKDYLGFRHIVRNIYGFELDTNRLEILIDNYFIVWHNFREDISNFLGWLHQLKDSIED